MLLKEMNATELRVDRSTFVVKCGARTQHQTASLSGSRAISLVGQGAVKLTRNAHPVELVPRC